MQVSALPIFAACLCFAFAATSAPQQPGGDPAQISRITRAEFETAAKAAMPLPVIRTMTWTANSRVHYVIEMNATSVPDAPEPVINVAFHTPEDADYTVFIKAMEMARRSVNARISPLSVDVRE